MTLNQTHYPARGPARAIEPQESTLSSRFYS